MKYIKRHIEASINESLSDTPVTIINGPRQSGKTTLLKYIQPANSTYLTLDNENTLLQAKFDPIGLLNNLDFPILIDEIQRAPELIRTIKLIVDENRQPGAFILTGSANLMTVPKLADSLAGRSEFLELLPFSQSEISQQPSNFISCLKANRFDSISSANVSNDQLIDKIINGGYPEALTRSDGRKNRWHLSYIKAILNRDIKEIFHLQKIPELEKLLNMLALLSTQQLVLNNLSKNLKLDSKSVDKYIYALESLYIILRIPAWHNNELKRATKQPKIYFIDTGLLCSIRNINRSTLQKDRKLFGVLLENFVASELIKLKTILTNQFQLFHYRDKDKREVDFILTTPENTAIGIEVKASMTVRQDMFKSINYLINSGVLDYGIVLYTGKDVIKLGPKSVAVPVSYLWH